MSCLATALRNRRSHGAPLGSAVGTEAFRETNCGEIDVRQFANTQVSGMPRCSRTREPTGVLVGSHAACHFLSGGVMSLSCVSRTCHARRRIRAEWISVAVMARAAVCWSRRPRAATAPAGRCACSTVLLCLRSGPRSSSFGRWCLNLVGVGPSRAGNARAAVDLRVPAPHVGQLATSFPCL